MPCYHPLTAYVARKVNKSGKRSMVFNQKEGYHDRRVDLPCGKCIGCRLEKSRSWAVRCVHEAQMHEDSCFVTLTFREACPLDGTKTDPTVSLHKHHFQRFMKRLRKHFPDKKIKYFHCGEYGEQFDRPHHHACIFGIDFFDRVQYFPKKWKRGDPPVFTSKTLDSIWQHGGCILGAVTFESAAYVARYVMKKVTGENAEYYYDGKKPEYCTMSRRPGLGATWLEKYSNDLYSKNKCIIRGKASKIPKYYDKRYSVTNPADYDSVHVDRIVNARDNPAYEVDRLIASEQIKKAQLGLLPRRLEE